MLCHFCQKEIETALKIGRQDRCPQCGMDLHICRNCIFYDPSSYNECREPQADRVVEKESSNFCDYFAPVTDAQSGPVVDPAAEAKKKLEGLFKK